jgi:hypothetical protein
MSEKPHTVIQSYIDGILENSEVQDYIIFDKVTVVHVKLPNGFVLTETSGCIDPANYNHQLGLEVCMQKIEDKIWYLEGYLLQDKLQLGGIK